jgi:hypothetical protein
MSGLGFEKLLNNNAHHIADNSKCNIIDSSKCIIDKYKIKNDLKFLSRKQRIKHKKAMNSTTVESYLLAIKDNSVKDMSKEEVIFGYIPSILYFVHSLYHSVKISLKKAVDNYIPSCDYDKIEIARDNEIKLEVIRSLCNDLEKTRQLYSLRLSRNRPIRKNCQEIAPEDIHIFIFPRDTKGYENNNNYLKKALNHVNFLKIFNPNIKFYFFKYEYNVYSLVQKLKTRLDKLKRWGINEKKKHKMQLSIYILGHGNPYNTIISNGEKRGIDGEYLLNDLDCYFAGFKEFPVHRVRVVLTPCHSEKYASQRRNYIDVVSLCKKGYTGQTNLYNLSLMQYMLNRCLMQIRNGVIKSKHTNKSCSLLIRR